NLACASHTVCIIRLYCTVKGGAAAWSASRSQSRMEAPERARSMVARAAGQPHFCLATERLCGPPGGGLFGFKFSSRPHPRKFGVKRYLAVSRSWRGNGVACFWATSFGKNLSAAARPRERSEAPWPHPAIHAAEHEFPPNGLPHAQPATEEAGRSM